MPRKRSTRRMRGGKLTLSGIKSALGKANSYLKKTRLISKVAGALDTAGVPYAGKIGSYAGQLGYGRRKRTRRRRR